MINKLTAVKLVYVMIIVVWENYCDLREWTNLNYDSNFSYQVQGHLRYFYYNYFVIKF